MTTYETLSTSPDIFWTNPEQIDSRIDAHHFRPRFIEAVARVLAIKGGRILPLARLSEKIGQPGDIRDYVADGIPILNAKDVRPLAVNGTPEMRVAYTVATQRPKQVLRGDDVLIVRTGANCGDVAWSGPLQSGFVVNSHVIPIRTRPGLSGPYLAAFLASDLGQTLLDREMTGAAQRQVSIASLNCTSVLVPGNRIQDYIGAKVELAEQCRAASFRQELGAQALLDNGLGATPTQICKQLELGEVFPSGAFASTVPPSILRERLDPGGYHPELLAVQAWASTRPEQFVSLQSLAVLQTSKRPRVGADGPARYFVSVLHIDNRGFVDRDAAKAYRPESGGRQAKHGDLLVSCINPAANRIGVCEIDDEMGGCSPEFAILRTKPNLDAHYVAFALRSPFCRMQLIHLGRGTSSSRRRVDEGELLDVQVPHVASASLIAKKVRTQHLLIALSHRLVEEAKADVEALMEGTLDVDAINTGKLRPPVPEDVPELTEGDE